MGLDCMRGTCFSGWVRLFFCPRSCCMEVWVGFSRQISSTLSLVYMVLQTNVSLSLLDAGGVQSPA